MKISFNWLKERFDNLPDVKELAELITFGAFEVESMEDMDGDTIIDLKVLPDRASYALSWNGLAYEIGAIIGTPYKKKEYEKIVGSDDEVNLRIEDKILCRRYSARMVRGVHVGDSPKWLTSELDKMGQRSINSIVDLTNYVMFTTGQPLHAFDADKVVGGIVVRRANDGEKITTLDGKEVQLSKDILVIADEERPLAIAGIKGGMAAEVTNTTRNIIVESANFEPSSTRRTSSAIGIKNESSRRFENDLPLGFATEAMRMISSLIAEINSNAKFGLVVDTNPEIQKPARITFSKEYVESRIGRGISNEDILNALDRIKCVLISAEGGNYIVEPPFFRLDLAISEDFVEEIARLLDYRNIGESIPPKLFDNPTVNREYFLSETVKDLLVREGFSEVILYTLGDTGQLETLYPVAKDKALLRDSLLPRLKESLELNLKNADLLGLDVVKEFEIGKVFDKDGEKLMLGIAVGFPKKVRGKKPTDVISEAVNKLSEGLGVKLDAGIKDDGLSAYGEISLDNVLGVIEVRDPYDEIDFSTLPDKKYKSFSKYQFSVRDVAVFVPNSVSEAEVRNIVESNAGDLCIDIRLFDEFKKDGKTSYAYRLVFQAEDKTLTEEEIKKPLDAVYEALKSRGWEIR